MQFEYLLRNNFALQDGHTLVVLSHDGGCWFDYLYSLEVMLGLILWIAMLGLLQIAYTFKFPPENCIRTTTLITYAICIIYLDGCPPDFKYNLVREFLDRCSYMRFLWWVVRSLLQTFVLRFEICSSHNTTISCCSWAPFVFLQYNHIFFFSSQTAACMVVLLSS